MCMLFVHVRHFLHTFLYKKKSEWLKNYVIEMSNEINRIIKQKLEYELHSFSKNG